MKLFYKIAVMGAGALSLFLSHLAVADHDGFNGEDDHDGVVIVDLDRPGRPGRPGLGGGGGGHGGGGHGGGGGPIIVPLESRILHCASGQYRYNECGVRGDIVHARLVRQMSAASCQEGRTYGFTRDSVWVDRGCRGNFEVYYRARHHFDDADEMLDE